MSRWILFTAALLGASAVALGAYGAHALRPGLIQSGGIHAWETAVAYHRTHALALLAIGLGRWRRPNRLLSLSAWILAAGTLGFSGSLYLLATTDIRGALVYLTPLGGTLLIAGWLLAAIAALTAGTSEPSAPATDSAR